MDFQIEAYKLHRSRVVEEDNLIDHRVNWMIFATALLLAIWGVIVAALIQLHPNDARQLLDVRLYELGLSVVGFVVSLCGFEVARSSSIAIKAARTEISRVSKQYRHERGRFQRHRQRLMVIKYVTGEVGSHSNGHQSAKEMPWLFMVVWFLVIIISGLSVIHYGRNCADIEQLARDKISSVFSRAIPEKKSSHARSTPQPVTTPPASANMVNAR